MTESGFLVRPYAGADRAAVLHLLEQVWPHSRHVEADFKDRWWWQFDQPPLFLAFAPGDLPVGLCAYVPFTLRARGRDLPSAWFVDFHVMQQYQGRGLGKQLTRAVQERFAITASLSQTAMAWRVFEKMGWHARTPVMLSMNPFPPRPVFGRRRGSLRLSTHAIDAGLPVAGALDALWIRVRDGYPVIAQRDASWLVRRYARQGGRDYLLVCGWRGDECAGYMVVRVVRPASDAGRPRAGLIVDYLVHPDDGRTFGTLLSAGIRLLREAHVRRAYCLSTWPRFQRILARHGFLSPAAPLVGRLLRSNIKWLTYAPTADADTVDPAAWFLTIGDCDLDYAWPRD